MSQEEILPLLPLRGLAIFPSMVLHLDVGRSKSVSAIEQAMLTDDQLVLLAAQKEVELEELSATDIYGIGTIAKVRQMLKLPNGSARVLVEGLKRGRIIDFLHEDDEECCCQVKVAEVSDREQAEVNSDALSRSVLTCFEQYAHASHRIPNEVYTMIADIEEPGNLADIITFHMPFKLARKQEILETAEPILRLEKVLTFLNAELEILELEQAIASRVKEQIDKTQKEYYLREQIKAIQHELGDKNGPTSDCEQFRSRLKALPLPEKVATKLKLEIDRLEKIPLASAENSMIRAYVDCLLSLPWGEEASADFDLNMAERILNADSYGMEKTKERILEHLAVQKHSTQIKGPILCLVGPPGVGKTSIAKSIAKAMQRNFAPVSLGGVRDEADIRGHRRTYLGALPGRIIQSIKVAGIANPVLLLDEIDKMVTEFSGDPGSALLEVLDSSQNEAFLDHYLDVPYDLSKVMFIATANSLHNIAKPLLDRMEIIHISGYTEQEKEEIAQKYLLPRQLREHGINGRELQIYKGAILQIIRNYTCEAGVRDLNRALGTLCRKTVKKIVSGHTQKVVITERNLADYLGNIKYRFGKSEESDQVGLSMGLAWTEYGGDVLPIEVSICAGKGSLVLTGQLGDVMQESAKAAFSYIRSRADELNISAQFTEDKDIHIHFPEGAIPKDGPSAGTAIATALVSALTGIPISRQVAMTGEITLRGRVLAIGGLKEKSLSAHRAGIKQVIYPAENDMDLADIPASIKQELQFVPVKHMDEVLQSALVRETCATY